MLAGLLVALLKKKASTLKEIWKWLAWKLETTWIPKAAIAKWWFIFSTRWEISGDVDLALKQSSQGQGQFFFKLEILLSFCLFFRLAIQAKPNDKVWRGSTVQDALIEVGFVSRAFYQYFLYSFFSFLVGIDRIEKGNGRNNGQLLVEPMLRSRGDQGRIWAMCLRPTPIVSIFILRQLNRNGLIFVSDVHPFVDVKVHDSFHVFDILDLVKAVQVRS